MQLLLQKQWELNQVIHPVIQTQAGADAETGLVTAD